MNGHCRFTIRKITAAETIPLRHRVLRPHQTPDDCRYPGDDAATSFHIGAVDATDQIIAVASALLCDEDRFQHFEDLLQIRLRGMAVAPELQGQGIGRAILEACLDQASQAGREIFWCNARVIAIDFYRKSRLKVLNEKPFEIDGIGPHHVMYKSLKK